MTITLNDPVQVGPGAHMFSWTTDLDRPTFDITKNGKRVASTGLERIVLMCDSSDVIAVTDDGSDPLDGSDAALEISWPALAGAGSYKVEEETSPGSGTFNIRAVIRDDGSTRFAFKTAPLGDDVATVYRVTPIGTNGNDGTATTVNRTVPRHPSTPDVAMTFSDATKKLTFAAA